MTKVEHTKPHRVFNREYLKYETLLVTDAELVLVDIPKGRMCKIIFADGEGNHIMVAPNDDAFIFYKDKEQIIQPFKPILISRIEEIEVGDWVYSVRGFIGKFGSFENSYENECRKILALPEHFSPQQLQMIVDGKLKGGDKVLVECYGIPYSPNGNIVATNYQYPFKELVSNFEIKHYIQFNPFTIYLGEEKMYTREDLKRAYFAGGNFKEIEEFEKWFEQNVK